MSKHANKQNDGETDSGNVAPGTTLYRITHAHEHRTLKTGEEVQVIESADKLQNFIFRPKDASLHSVEDPYSQYVHLIALLA